MTNCAACPVKELLSCKLLAIPAAEAAWYVIKCTQNTVMSEITQGKHWPVLHVHYASTLLKTKLDSLWSNSQPSRQIN